MVTFKTPMSSKCEGERILDRLGHKMSSSVMCILVRKCLLGYFKQPQPTSIRTIQLSSIDPCLPIIPPCLFLTNFKSRTLHFEPRFLYPFRARTPPYIHVTFTIENGTSPDQNKRKRLVSYPYLAIPKQNPTRNQHNRCNFQPQLQPSSNQTLASNLSCNIIPIPIPLRRYRSIGIRFALDWTRLNIISQRQSLMCTDILGGR